MLRLPGGCAPRTEGAGHRTPVGLRGIPELGLEMTTYLYVLAVEKTFVETELGSVKDEICRLFDCTEIEVSGATDFTVYTPLAPEQVKRALGELSKRFGAEFKAGAKVH